MSVIEESNQFNLPLALTMGDPAGISCEITLKAWWNLAKMARKKPIRKPLTFFVIADPHLFRALSRKLNIEAPIQLVETPEQAASVFSSALPVMPLNLPAAVIPGRPDPENASSVINSIDRALDLALGGRTAGIVTNPIHKKCLAEAGFTYSGHTEYLAECAGIGSQVAMMLATPRRASNGSRGPGKGNSSPDERDDSDRRTYYRHLPSSRLRYPASTDCRSRT